MTGIVKTVTDRGFGFLTDLAGQDYFFHWSDVADGTIFTDLREGDEVTFEVVSPQPAKGPRAAVVRAKQSAPAEITGGS